MQLFLKLENLFLKKTPEINFSNCININSCSEMFHLEWKQMLPNILPTQIKPISRENQAMNQSVDCMMLCEKFDI